MTGKGACSKTTEIYMGYEALDIIGLGDSHDNVGLVHAPEIEYYKLWALRNYK